MARKKKEKTPEQEFEELMNTFVEKQAKPNGIFQLVVSTAWLICLWAAAVMLTTFCVLLVYNWMR